MSESVEMYLVSISQLNEVNPTEPVPISKLANRLGIQPVSANQMVRKLEEMGYLKYLPYKGVELRSQGRRRASQVLRKRRLWEVFLYEHLHLTSKEAERIACSLEHALPNDAIERLADYLNHPVVSPEGKPIPSPINTNFKLDEVPLSALATSAKGEITRISADSAIRTFLAKQGFGAQMIVEVLAVAKDGNRLIKNEADNTIHISKSLTDSIYVKRYKKGNT
jgi:DtxR family Mn-dependent transcriptional regulator